MSASARFQRLDSDINFPIKSRLPQFRIFWLADFLIDLCVLRELCGCLSSFSLEGRAVIMRDHSLTGHASGTYDCPVTLDVRAQQFTKLLGRTRPGIDAEGSEAFTQVGSL